MADEVEREEAEKLSDPSDRAPAEEMRETEARMREVRMRLTQAQKPRADGSYEFLDCEECGNEIGEERLRLASANHLCFHCASAKETLARRGLARIATF